MFNYIKIRKKGTLNWKALRKNGKILVFDSVENGRAYINNYEDYVCKIIPIICHPTNRKSPIHGKPYEKIGW